MPLNGILHHKEFGVYHWDTFDNETSLVDQFDRLDGAIAFVQERYGESLRPTGADQIDIVDQKGNIVQKFALG